MNIKIPKRYIPNFLTTRDKKKQRHQLAKSRRAYRKGKYISRKPVKSFKSKRSHHLDNVEKMYGIKQIKLNKELSNKTRCKLSGLRKIVKKGQGAYYSSGSRPNQTAHSWGYARLASAITGGKASAVDYKILLDNCKNNSKALRLAKKNRKGHKYGTRKVAKTRL